MKMRTRTKIATSIIAVILSCVLLFTVVLVNNNTNTTVNADAKVRTVELSNDYFDDQSIFDEFDEHELQTDENGFELVAKKTFDSSLFSEMDLVGLSDAEEDVTVRYEVQYIESEDTVLLTVTIENEDEIPVVDTIPGLISCNTAGEPDVMFVIDGEYTWLSELYQAGVIDEVGFFSWLKKTAKKIANAICEYIIRPAFSYLTKAAVQLMGSNAAYYGATILNMSEEVDSNNNRTGIYHADFDCWQAKFGYTDFYDKVFNAATYMERGKFPVDVNGDGVYDYVLWAWKGNYLNLGAGAELGIYKKWSYGNDLWIVDKDFAMTMSMEVKYYDSPIINWSPSEKQWWITGFNSNQQYLNVRPNELSVIYNLTFDMKGNKDCSAQKLYTKFKDEWLGTDSRWSFPSNLNAKFKL